MRETWDLGGSWTLRGWRQHDWELGTSFVRALDGSPDVPAVPATVPGSVRGALTAAGVVVSPFDGVASRSSEWIENRHWTWTTDLTGRAGLDDALAAHPDARVVLCAESLDDAGHILLGDTTVGGFSGAFVPHEFDLTDALRAGARLLSVVFTDPPDALGQIGRTSTIREQKARFNYGWDWTPRIVQIGIAGPVRLELRQGPLLDAVRISATYDPAAGTGRLTLLAQVPDTGPTAARVSVRGPGVRQTVEVPDCAAAALEVGPVERWELAGRGEQALYDVRVELLDAAGAVSDVADRRVGFREIRWEPAEGAPSDAEPWVCVVNDRPTFLAGVNWVPIRPDYADVTPEAIRQRITTYRDLGIVVLRVWGGAALETAAFYEACDELGLLVWQELPLSSSGIDNTPPDDPAFTAQLAATARSYALRRMHHPSLALWGGGNELGDRDPDGRDVPLRGDHPAPAAARAAFTALDPDRRFVPTSPTGPRAWAAPEEYGQGLHHDVHGPWDQYSDTAAQWQEYWDADDSLLRSEVGVGGASSLALLERHGLTGPTTTAADRAALRELWRHSSSWWLAHYDTWDGSGTLASWVEASQRRQADLLGYAAMATLRRFPRVGGFIVWLGHDTFPCPVSLSILDFDGEPKPVAHALAAVFRRAAEPATLTSAP